MTCIECGQAAIALCPICLVGQCETHLSRSRAWAQRSGALAGCRHSERPSDGAGAESRLSGE